MAATPVLLVDGHHLLYRAYFGFPARITSRDKYRDLTGVFGFLALLRKAHHTYTPDHGLVVVFDGEHGTAARTRTDAAYKAPRAQADHTPIRSLPAVKNGLDFLAVPWIEIDTAEGDDTLATLTRQASEADHPVTLMSGDKDLLQLLTHPHTRVLNTAAPEPRRISTPADVFDRYGIHPGQWPDYRALTGDPADNIPGIRGIGPATAARLLRGGLTLDDLPAGTCLNTRAGHRLTQRWDDVLRWRDLIRLDYKIPLDPPAFTGPTAPMPPAAQVLEHLDLW